MSDRSCDWMLQAERNLAQSHESAAAGRHEWACFSAQQTVEMAVKALHLRLGQEGWGHVVRRLLEELPSGVSVSEELLDSARVLDAYYIPTRHPNGHPAGAPGNVTGNGRATRQFIMPVRSWHSVVLKWPTRRDEWAALAGHSPHLYRRLMRERLLLTCSN